MLAKIYLKIIMAKDFKSKENNLNFEWGN